MDQGIGGDDSRSRDLHTPNPFADDQHLPSNNAATEFSPEDLCFWGHWDFSILEENDAAGYAINEAPTTSGDYPPIEAEKEKPTNDIAEGMDVDSLYSNLNNDIGSLPSAPLQSTPAKTLPATNTCSYILHVVDPEQDDNMTMTQAAPEVGPVVTSDTVIDVNSFINQSAASAAQERSVINICTFVQSSETTVETPAQVSQQATVVVSAPPGGVICNIDNFNPQAQSILTGVAMGAPPPPALPAPRSPCQSPASSPDSESGAQVSDATKWRHKMKPKVQEMESNIARLEKENEDFTEQINMSVGVYIGQQGQSLKGTQKEKRDHLLRSLLGDDYPLLKHFAEQVAKHDCRQDKKVKINPRGYLNKLKVLLEKIQSLHTLKKQLHDKLEQRIQQ